MEIICQSCQSKFRIADEKVPSDRTVNLNCPKCGNKIVVSPRQETAPDPSFDFEEETPAKGPDAEKGSSMVADDTMSSDMDDDLDASFDFVEEEGEMALVCERDPDLKKMMKDALVALEYHVTEADNIRDALTKMRYHTYDFIMVNEKFGSETPTENSVLIYLQRLPMSIRRNIFVTLVSDTLRTMDRMMAFNRSVNLVVNKKNIPEVHTILKRSILENELFFKIFKETLKEEGRV